MWNKPKKCAGRFVKGPLNGTWAYTYTERKDGSTRLVYDMDYELGGLLRFAAGLLGPQYAAGIHQNPEALKRYVEAGKSPKPKREPPPPPSPPSSGGRSGPSRRPWSRWAWPWPSPRHALCPQRRPNPAPSRISACEPPGPATRLLPRARCR